MEAPTPIRALAIVAVAALVLIFIPATQAGGDAAEPQNHDEDCILDKNPGSSGFYEWKKEEIILPKPLTPNLPVTSLAWALLYNDANHDTVEDTSKEPVNGLDAFVIDLGCQVQDTAYCLTGFDSGVNSYDLQVTFRDRSFQSIAGPINPADSRDVCGDDTDLVDQPMPDGTRFIEIVAADGTPGACGCLDDDTFLPATVQVTFKLAT